MGSMALGMPARPADWANWRMLTERCWPGVTPAGQVAAVQVVLKVKVPARADGVRMLRWAAVETGSRTPS